MENNLIDIKVCTSRGVITVIDTHVSEIKIPADYKDLDRLVLTIGEHSFRVQGWVDNAKNTNYDGRAAC